eukprot:9313329-Alexandrium_andersonii.AAC.1
MVFVAVDTDTGMIFSSQVTTKGAGDAYNVRAFSRFLQSLGHDKLTLQTDGENPSPTSPGRCRRSRDRSGFCCGPLREE